jgi:hypothetical protein
MVCLGNIFINTLHKGAKDKDDDDDNDNDNNNNNNNKKKKKKYKIFYTVNDDLQVYDTQKTVPTLGASRLSFSKVCTLTNSHLTLVLSTYARLCISAVTVCRHH